MSLFHTGTHRGLVVVPIEGAESVAVVRAERVGRVALVPLHPQSIKVLLAINPAMLFFNLKEKEKREHNSCCCYYCCYADQ